MKNSEKIHHSPFTTCPGFISGLTIKMSQLTTHILDTSTGRPAQSVRIRLEQNGKLIAEGITNEDGRISDLLSEGTILEPGNYELIFDTGSYFSDQGIKTFYPKAVIHFTVFDDSHYHVPLLLNPFGYSTYRGS